MYRMTVSLARLCVKMVKFCKIYIIFILEMSFTPSKIAFDKLKPIRGTKWSMLRHTKNLFFFYHRDYENLKARSDSVFEGSHISLFIRKHGVDHHATFVYTDTQGRHFKRHHGYRFRDNRQQFKNCRSPCHLRGLFEQFERDIYSLDIPNHILNKMVF